jgi:hypothetical protein
MNPRPKAVQPLGIGPALDAIEQIDGGSIGPRVSSPLNYAPASCSAKTPPASGARNPPTSYAWRPVSLVSSLLQFWALTRYIRKYILRAIRAPTALRAPYSWPEVPRTALPAQFFKDCGYDYQEG